MDAPEFAEADVARVALSEQLQRLSELLRLTVAAEDIGAAPAEKEGLAAHLWSLLETEVPLVQEAVAGYVRTRGGSWQDLAELSGLTEDEARERWAALPVRGPADPAAAAAALDAWYVRHAQVEPLARVRYPFSRLLNGRSPDGQHQCLICGKYEGNTVPAWAGFPVPPGGHLVDDGTWRVGHGPTPYWPAGTLLIESRRHFLDYADFDHVEAATLGPLVRRLTAPLKEATGASRIHIFSCMEGTEHFHLWMVPRVEGQTPGRTFMADPGHCTHDEAEEVIGRVRQAMERTEARR
ncbi:HIT family protein [Kitasatospora sp. SUK 42]|uniref:HIT family protein n=1 Tax=Kitasatospora sp. SUK 42 TaxID=1588882 RepID=UPI0018CB1EB4|nr:hypothetical protein [Kitasatospora sp. SUK 42]MBV2156635.1 hypothetical protein [Kitasatospora sp. SUK 42]